MTKEEIVLRLYDLGWLAGWPRNADAIPDVAVVAAKAGYAQFHGVPVDQIEPHMALPRCALPDRLELGEQLRQWPTKDITWAVVNDLPGLSRDQFVQAVAQAFGWWAEVCGINPRMIADVNQAMIIITVGHIDGPAGTLAWSELPGSGVRRVTQKYDSGERQWSITIPPSANALLAQAVIAHELGHGAIGSDHLSGGPNLMNPTYNPRVIKPQAGDIARAQQSYGPPISSPIPTPGTPTVPPSLPGGSMLGTLLKLLPLIAKHLPMIVQYLPDIIKLIEELGKIFKQNPAALDTFVAELKAVDHQQLTQAMTAPQAFTSDDVALLAQLIELLRSLAAAVGVHVVVGPKVTVGVDVKKDAPK